MAHGVWNAGFSRHSPPQAGGGANLITQDGAHVRDVNTLFSWVAGGTGARTRGCRCGVAPNVAPEPRDARCPPSPYFRVPHSTPSADTSGGFPLRPHPTSAEFARPAGRLIGVTEKRPKGGKNRKCP